MNAPQASIAMQATASANSSQPAQPAIAVPITAAAAAASAAQTIDEQHEAREDLGLLHRFARSSS